MSEEVINSLTMEEEEEDFVRRLLVISVGSSASIHLLGGVATEYPDLLFKNKIMIIETSKKMLNDAIDHLTRIYNIHYSKMRGKEPSETKHTFPPNKFKAELRNNSILLAEHGGGATPERGLAYYQNRRADVLEKIVEIVSGETGEKEISGIIVLGSAGKGTGTLVTPTLVGDLMKEKGIPKPLGFQTLPFRFDKVAIENARKILDIIRNVPMFLLDYERVIGSYIYLSGEIPPKDISMIALYKMVVSALSTTLSTLIEALNYSIKCNPPLDWSDIITILKPGDIGTITYTVRFRKDEFMKKWQDDLTTLLLLRTNNRPMRTRGVVIIKGIDIPFGVSKGVSEFFSKFFNAEAQQYLLNRGNGFSIVALVHGFDPYDITPPLQPSGGILRRIFGF